jgi:hypothetical protein
LKGLVAVDVLTACVSVDVLALVPAAPVATHRLFEHASPVLQVAFEKHAQLADPWGQLDVALFPLLLHAVAAKTMAIVPTKRILCIRIG